MNKAVELKGIVKNFSGVEALRGIDLAVKHGERVAIIGPSGAGKSTMMRIMTGEETADAGFCLIADKHIGEYSAPKLLAREIGMVRQQFDLIEELSVLHNVLVGRFTHWGAMKSLLSLLFPQEKEVAIAALERLGIGDKANVRAAKLSGGQKQRVAVARLLVQEPRVMLADEPVASLDPTWADDVLSVLTMRSQQEGAAVIATLHTVDHVRRYFDRIVGMRKGQILFDVETNQLSDELLETLYAEEGRDEG